MKKALTEEERKNSQWYAYANRVKREKERIIDMLYDGVPVRKITEVTGVSKCPIYKIKKELGIEGRKYQIDDYSFPAKLLDDWDNFMASSERPIRLKKEACAHR